ncbi:MAG: M48 family metalloprotease [Proteobacteria bacterium]|nr:M48 family metalloprotease [Pseudomonadota bacterium]
MSTAPRSRRRVDALLLLATLAWACATNPVTGRSELNLVSRAGEIQIGEDNYGPTRQMQGGDYTVDPELTTYVQSVGQRLAAVSDRPDLPYEFQVLNSSVPNAWALPGGKIAINRGLLLELENEAQLAAVLGHEIVHAAARHGAQAMERGLLLQGAVVAVAVATADSDYGGLAVGGAGLGAQLASQKYGRDAERESDLYGMRYMQRAGYDPEAAVELQQIFVRLSEGRAENWLAGLFASHPPSRERVEANRATLAALRAENASRGEVGRERYQRRLARLRASKTAYAAHDEGRKALGRGDTARALAAAERALKGEPAEPRFHELRGDIRLQQRRYADAVTNYDRALARDPGHALTRLRRGVAKRRLGDSQGARRDLERTLELLPTSLAHLELAELAEARGDRAMAVRHYRVLAPLDSAHGQRARRALQRLEPPPQSAY